MLYIGNNSTSKELRKWH